MPSVYFIPYSRSDYTIAKNTQYPRVSQVFHETPQKWASGKLRHSWTHNKKVIQKILNKPTDYKVKQYANECMRTFRVIPDFEVFSASEYARVHNISHVTAKKRLQKLCETDNTLIQISPKYFVKCNSPQGVIFVKNIVHVFHQHAKPDERYSKTLVVAKRYTISTVLKKLQQLKEYALTHPYAYYKQIAKVISQPILSWLIKVGIVKHLKLDYLMSRVSIVYLSSF